MESVLTLNCLAVDDNEIDLDLVCNFISKVPFLNLVASCNSPLDVQGYLINEQVDLIFSDIDMPDINGMEMIKSVAKPPQIVFLTSFPGFALEGFAINATDYLLKPFTFDRFLQSANRALERHIAKLKLDKAETRTSDKPSDDHFYIRSEHKFVKVLYDDVIYIEAIKDYVKIFTREQTYMPPVNMKTIESELPVSDFLRINRSNIINVKKIESFDNNFVTIRGMELAIGESYRQQVLQLLEGKLVKRKDGLL